MNRFTTAAWLALGIGSTNAWLAGCDGNESPPPPTRTTSEASPSAATPPAAAQPRIEMPDVTVPAAPAGTAPAASPTTEPPARPTTVTPINEPASTAPSTQPSMEISMPAAPAQDNKTATFAGYAAPKPATWIWQPPSTQFALADYVVPGRDGADQGRIRVSQAGGSLDMNIARWKSQFRADAQGGEVDPKITEVEAGDIVIDVVEFAGEYQAMGSPSFTPGQIMIVGIVPGNTQHVFIRFTGPAATVEANREAFLEMLRGIHPVEPEK